MVKITISIFCAKVNSYSSSPVEKCHYVFWQKQPTLIVRVNIGHSLPLGRRRLRDSSPPISVTFRFLPRLMEYLQSSFVHMEYIFCDWFLAQLLICRSQVILRSFQYPVRYGLVAQMDSIPINLLFLTDRGEPITNFWGMIWAMAYGVANLPRMTFFSLRAYITGVILIHFS